MRRLALILLALTCAMPSAAAASLGLVQALGLQTEGGTTTEGTVAVVHTVLRKQAGPGEAIGTISLVADEVDVEIDHQDYDARVAGTATTPDRRYGSHATLSKFDGTFSASGDDSHFFLMPSGSDLHFVLDGEATRVTPANQDAASPDRWVPSDRPDLRVPTTGTAAVQPVASAVLLVKGDFVLTAWDWNIDATHADGRTAIQTGEEVKALVPGAGQLRGVDEVKQRQAYLFVRGGELTVHVVRPEDIAVFTSDAEVSFSQGAHIAAAHGVLSTPHGQREVRNAALTLDGAGAVRVAGTEDLGLQIEMLRAEGATVDGAPLSALTAPAVRAVSAWPWLVVGALASVILVAAYGFPSWYFWHVHALELQMSTQEARQLGWRKRRAAGYMALANYAHRRRHDRLASVFLVAARRERGSLAYRLLNIQLLRARARWHHAIRELLALDSQLLDNRDAAWNAAHLATVYSAAGRHGEAQEWRRLAIARNPDVAGEALGVRRWADPAVA